MPNALPRAAEPDEHRHATHRRLSKTHGVHTFKAGFDVNLIHEVMINLFQGGGLYAYSGSAADRVQQLGRRCCGNQFRRRLTGRHWSTFTQVTDPITHVGKDDYWEKDLDGVPGRHLESPPQSDAHVGRAL